MRLFRLVRAKPVWGTQKNSKWSLPSTRASRSASTASIRIGSFTARRWKAGTSWRVRVDTSPMAPTPTRAAWKTSGSSSGEQATTEPSAATMRIATICAASPGNCAPVPWVAVDVAPATVW